MKKKNHYPTHIHEPQHVLRVLFFARFSLTHMRDHLKIKLLYLHNFSFSFPSAFSSVIFFATRSEMMK